MGGLQSALLLLGIVGVPLLLLAGGHRFRRLGRRMRGAFWGGVAGYAVGVVAWALAAIAPAQMWAHGSVRLFAIVMAPVLFGISGFLLGAIVGNQPKPRGNRHRKNSKALRSPTPAREHDPV